MERIYLDHSATTPVHPEVLGAMMTFFANHFGNPSSAHREGRMAREAVESARVRVAAAIGADPAEIVFTGSGTEADNLAILGSAFGVERGRNHIITSAIEHPAVRNACLDLAGRGFEVTFLPVDGSGRVDPDAVRHAITEKTFLVSVMQANNEVGTVQPLKEIGAITRENGVLLHTDAVQSVGKISVSVEELRLDLLSLSGHKICGPKGTGALYVRRGTPLRPITFGGSQEGGLRNATENVPGIVGLGKACEIAVRDLGPQADRQRRLRDLLEEGILAVIPDARINGHPVERLPHLLSVSFPRVTGGALVRELDLRGISASAGSACSSGETKISHVLTALGLPEELAGGTVRFSLGRDTTEGEIGRTVAVLKALVEKRRALAELEDGIGTRGCR